MARIKLNLRNLLVTEKIAKGRHRDLDDGQWKNMSNSKQI